MRVWDGFDEKEGTMHVIKGYVEVNGEVGTGERDTSLSRRSVDGKTKEWYKCVNLSMKKKMCPSQKDYNIVI